MLKITNNIIEKYLKESYTVIQSKTRFMHFLCKVQENYCFDREESRYIERTFGSGKSSSLSFQNYGLLSISGTPDKWNFRLVGPISPVPWICINTSLYFIRISGTQDKWNHFFWSFGDSTYWEKTVFHFVFSIKIPRKATWLNEFLWDTGIRLNVFFTVYKRIW